VAKGRASFEPSAASGVEQFAIDLANGAVLCTVLNALHKGAVKRIHQGAALKQYQCKMNTDQFLSSCALLFSWESDELFEPDDLYRGTRFERVVQTLSKLSHTSKAKALGLKPFPEKEVTIYTACDDDDGEESIYSNVQEVMAKKRDAKPASTSSRRMAPMGPAIYAGDDGGAAAAQDEEENIYGEVAKIIGAQESIYDCMVAGQVRRVTGTIARNKTKRDFVRDELVDTEAGYLEALRSIKSVYIDPVLEHAKSVGLIQPDDTDRLFMNLTKLIPVHKKLVMRLQRMDNVGDVFCDAADDMMLYADFCSKLNDAHDFIDKIQSDNRGAWDLLEKLRAKAPQRFDLKSMLCLPMQRMLKYPLLLKDLRKSTPSGHPEHQTLPRALDAMQELAKYIDESTRDWENLKQCKDIEESVQGLDYLAVGSGSCGRYTMDDEVKIRFDATPKKLEKFYVFAFQKTLVVTKQDRFKSVFNFKFPMNLAHFAVNLAQKEKRSRGQDVALKLTATVPSSGDYSCTMIFKTGAIRTTWQESLKTSKMELSPPHALRLGSMESGVKNDAATQVCKWGLCTFDVATPCFVCRKLLRGLVSQGYRCGGDHGGIGCQKAVHLECANKVPFLCEGRTSRQSARAKAWKNLGGTKSMGEADRPLPPLPPGAARSKSDSERRAAPVPPVESGLLPPKIVPRPSRRRSERLPTETVPPTNKAATLNPGDLARGSRPSLRRPPPPLPSESAVAPPSPGGADAPPPLQPRAASVRSRAADRRGPRKSYTNVEPVVPALPPSRAPGSPGSALRGRPSAAAGQPESASGYVNQKLGPSYANHAASVSGAVPKRVVRTQRWYVGKLSRVDATKLFDGQPLGAYIVRESMREGREGSYTLDVAVRAGDFKPKHIPIEFDGGLYSVSRKKKFLSVPDLIAHYQENSLIEHFPNVDTKLCKPIGNQCFTDEVFEVVRSYEAQSPQELTVHVGQRLMVLERPTSGWISVVTNDTPVRRGLVPESYLQSLG